MQGELRRIDAEIEANRATSIMINKNAWEVSAETLEPTWMATKSPLAAPAKARPKRSKTWANCLTRARITFAFANRPMA